MARILVTGGCGFIGSHLVDSLLEDGHNVVVIDNLSSGSIDNLQGVLPRIQFYESDIRNLDLLCKLMQGVDIVFHQAAVASVGNSVMDPVETHEVNVHGTLNVLLAAREARIKRVIFASSAAIYGSLPSAVKTENMGFMPLSPYAASKLAGEGYMQAFYHSYGLETLCLRYFNVYGPRQDPNSDYAAVIPSFAFALICGDRLTIYGDGTQSRDFCHVRDVVKANMLAIRARKACGQPINIGSGEAIAINDLAFEMRQILTESAEPLYAETRPGDVRHSLSNISRAYEELGYSPEISLRTGLEETLKWYEQHLTISKDLTNIV